jgi:hypothetical protein
MHDDLTTITASLLVREDGALVHGYVVTMTSEPLCVASLMPCTDLLSEAWREDFRTLCQHIVEEQFQAQGLRANWVMPRAQAQAHAASES